VAGGYFQRWNAEKYYCWHLAGASRITNFLAGTRLWLMCRALQISPPAKNSPINDFFRPSNRLYLAKVVSRPK
jgi:hypothetical protein